MGRAQRPTDKWKHNKDEQLEGRKETAEAQNEDAGNINIY